MDTEKALKLHQEVNIAIRNPMELMLPTIRSQQEGEGLISILKASVKVVS